MAHLEVNQVGFTLPDGRPLLDGVQFRVGEGQRVALIGPNGTGKTTLTRIISGDLTAHEGAVTTSGTLAVMNQFVGKVRDDSTVRDLLITVAPERIRKAALAVDAAELRIMEIDDEPSQMDYAQALADWGDAGGYDFETTVWDKVTTGALGMPFEKAQWRAVSWPMSTRIAARASRAWFCGSEIVNDGATSRTHTPHPTSPTQQKTGLCWPLIRPGSVADMPSPRWR